MRQNMIEIQNVSFRYGSEIIFENITFTLAEGEFLVILGPNGAGKTTLLRLLAGLDEPTEGSVRIDERSVSMWQKDGKISFVPQQYNKNAAAFPATVEEIVAMGRKDSRSLNKKDQAEIKRALSWVGMEMYLHRRIGSLSGGQQQRILVAQAICKHPEILLLDEPTSGVDYLAGAELMAMLRHLNQREGTTIVMVSHDVERAVSYGTKVACMNRGICYYGDQEGFWERHGQGIHFTYMEGE